MHIIIYRNLYVYKELQYKLKLDIKRLYNVNHSTVCKFSETTSIVDVRTYWTAFYFHNSCQHLICFLSSQNWKLTWLKNIISIFLQRIMF